MIASSWLLLLTLSLDGETRTARMVDIPSHAECLALATEVSGEARGQGYTGVVALCELAEARPA